MDNGVWFLVLTFLLTTSVAGSSAQSPTQVEELYHHVLQAPKALELSPSGLAQTEALEAVVARFCLASPASTAQSKRTFEEKELLSIGDPGFSDLSRQMGNSESVFAHRATGMRVQG